MNLFLQLCLPKKRQELAAGGALLGSHEALTLYRFKARKNGQQKLCLLVLFRRRRVPRTC